MMIFVMAKPSPERIADIILSRRQVYGLDADSQIREAANRLTARALFEILQCLDDESTDFAAQLSDLLSGLAGPEVCSLVAFHTGDIPTADAEAGAPPQPERPTEYYLKLVFRDEDAAYYQFPLFPDLDADYVLGAARKRTGAVQHIRITLRIEESTADDFQRAPSNGI